jgi:hypothetical protein
VKLTHYLSAALVGVALASTSMPSSALTGNELLLKTQAFENASAGKDRGGGPDQIEAGYAMGYVDAASTMLWASDKICLTPKVTFGQMLKIVHKYMREHPEELHEDGLVLVLKALRGPFPCKGKP